MRPFGILRAHHSKLAVLHRVFDLLMIFTTLICVVQVADGRVRAEHYTAGLVAVFVFYFLSDLKYLYVSWRCERIRHELLRVAGIWAATFFVILTLEAAFLNASFFSLQDAFCWFLLALAGLISYRVSVRLLLQILRQRGMNSRTVAIAGAGEAAQRLARSFMQAPWMGLRFVGFFDDSELPVSPAESAGAEPAELQSLEKLVQLARQGRLDHIYITLPVERANLVAGLVEKLRDTTTTVHLVPDVFIFDLLHARSQNIDGVLAISIFESPVVGFNGAIKRLEDIVFSILILALVALPMLGIAAAVKLSSPGPVLFRQRRYGVDGQLIEVWKFRSMSTLDDGASIQQATRNDARITPLGAFLRRTSLDELPQFFNVLGGSMSIVGPRPHAVAHNELYRGKIARYMQRHKVKPGITGWAQINGWRGETSTLDKMQARVEHDLEYINNWSFWWDVKIILLTVFKGFTGKNAY